MAELDFEFSQDRQNKELRKTFKDILDLGEADPKKTVVLNFKDLQLLRIKTLQQKLFDHQMRFRLGGYGPEQFEDALKTLDADLMAYTNALRNYEFLSHNSRDTFPQGLPQGPKGFTLFGAPQELQYEDFVRPAGGLLPLFNRNEDEPPERARAVFKVRDWIKYTRFPEKAHGGDYYISTLQFREIDGYLTQERKEKQEGGERLAMAIFGGGALIGPTLVMTLHSGLTTSLVTVCLATLFFALALAKFSKSITGKDILAATAAYAAVLVVFVGTSLSPSNTVSSSP